ncbi:MAG: RES domain-containing protein [Bacteroidota bacterium]
MELKQFIITNSVEKGKCDYCSGSLNFELLNIDELLDFFSEFINIFKNDPTGIPLNEIIQNDWNLFSSKSVCLAILSDILSTLNSSLTNPQVSVCYISEIIENVSYWEKLKEDIKWNRRFLTNSDKLTELGWDSFFNKTITWSKSEPLFRARLHYSGDQKIFSFKDMGCPDKIKAPSGRANPQGIPFLYLSTDIKTTLFEIRASYLDEVSVGKFEVANNNKMVLVDFTEIPSAFLYMDDIINYTKIILLKKYISSDLSKPIRRYDSELEYVPTQFICEYIRNITGVDGILFESSLHLGGKNIVLFDQNIVKCISVEMYRVTKVEIEEQKL